MPTMQLTKISPTSPVASDANAVSAASATATTEIARSVSAYVSRSFFKKTVFIVGILFATIFNRSLTLIAGLFERLFGKVNAGGVEQIPEKGSFTLAVNHFHGAWTPFVSAAVLAAVKRRRPDVVDDVAMIVGQREDKNKKRFFVARWIRGIVMWVLDRWKHNVLRIALGNKTVAIDSLRTWKRVAKERPTFVFPEGLASITFEKVRPGAGQFARALDVPCIPCAVWYHQGQWHVEFGEPIEWAPNSELSDLQVGLSIARLLPGDLAPKWRDLLARWDRVHGAV